MSNTYTPHLSTDTVELTEAQKKYRDHYHKSMREYYDQLYNKPVIDEKGKKTTMGKLQSLPSLDDDFMPRSAPTTADIRAANPGLGNTWRRLQEYYVRYMTSYTIDNYQNTEVLGVPLRYMPETNSPTIMNEHHSFDVSQNYKQFMSNLVFKTEVDSAYAVGKAISQYLKDGLANAKGSPKYPKLASWIEDMITLHVFNDVDQTDFHFKEWNIPVPESLKHIYGDTLKTNAFGIAKFLKAATSMVIMAVKPIQATWNGMLIFFTNHFKGVTNSIATRFFGVDKDQVSFTFSDIAKANGI
jgi:hypothetical protein